MKEEGLQRKELIESELPKEFYSSLGRRFIQEIEQEKVAKCEKPDRIGCWAATDVMCN